KATEVEPAPSVEPTFCTAPPSTDRNRSYPTACATELHLKVTGLGTPVAPWSGAISEGAPNEQLVSIVLVAEAVLFARFGSVESLLVTCAVLVSGPPDVRAVALTVNAAAAPG